MVYWHFMLIFLKKITSLFQALLVFVYFALLAACGGLFSDAEISRTNIGAGASIQPRFQASHDQYVIDLDYLLGTFTLDFSVNEGTVVRAILSTDSTSREDDQLFEGNVLLLSNLLHDTTPMLSVVADQLGRFERHYFFNFQRETLDAHRDNLIVTKIGHGFENIRLQSNDYFADRFDFDGKRLVVGMQHDNGDVNATFTTPNQNAVDSGAVYVFVKNSSGAWILEQYIKAFNAQAGDKFGYSVAIQENFLIVSAPNEDSSATGVISAKDLETYDLPEDTLSSQDSGAVYVYQFNETTANWELQNYLKGESVEENLLFGSVVNIVNHNEHITIPVLTNAKKYVEVFSGDLEQIQSGQMELDLTRSQKLTLPIHGEDFFSDNLEITPDYLAIGLPAYSVIANDMGRMDYYGALVVYRKEASGLFVDPITLTSPRAMHGEVFGYSVAISEQTIAVGAPGNNIDSRGVTDVVPIGRQGSGFRGAVYIYTTDDEGRSWHMQNFIKSPNPHFDAFYGSSIGLDGSVLAVGSPHSRSISLTQLDSINTSGAVYLYTAQKEDPKTGAFWKEAYVEKTTYPLKKGDGFGARVRLKNGLLLASSKEVSPDSSELENSGSIYIIE